MPGTLTAAQIDWLADFCEMPALPQMIASSSAAPPAVMPSSSIEALPVLPSAPVRQAVDKEEPPPAAPRDPAPDPSPMDKSKMEFVQSQRLAELDEAVSSGVAELMQEAERQAGQAQGIASIHGVDLEQPEAAMAPLKQAAASTLGSGASKELKQAFDKLNAAKTLLQLGIISFNAKSMELQRSLEAIRDAPKPTEETVAENDPGSQTEEYIVDGGTQFAKFLSELPGMVAGLTGTLLLAMGGAVSTMLELVGLDYLKDNIKGGNSDDLLASLKASVEDLQDKVDKIVDYLKKIALKQAEDAAKILADLLPVVLDAYDNFASAADDFSEILKADMGKLMAHGGKHPAQPEYMKGIMVVHGAVLDAVKAGKKAAAARLKQSKVVGDLRYWASVLVPLGARAHDGNVMSDGREYTIYQHGSRQIAFFLPSSGLTNSLEDLSRAVQIMRKLESAADIGLEKLGDRWMKAMTKAMSG